jgi:hypothetical protein
MLAMLVLPAGATARTIPRGWIGMMADGPLFEPNVDLGQQFRDMRDAGVESVRVAFYWDQTQPYETFDQVPPEELGQFTSVWGVPTGFGFTDAVVAAAEAADLRVMPVVLRAPHWATRDPAKSGSPPSARGRVAFKRFLKALVFRYRMGHAIRAWQVFNEPNMLYSWRTKTPISAYVKLLKAAYPAIKRADPNAKVVAAGLSGFSARALARVYAAGGRRYFDVAAVHPFRATVGAALRVLHSARAVMDNHGDAAKPLIVSEISWASARGKVPRPNNVTTTEIGQANRVFRSLRRIAAQRETLKLYGVFWSTWVSREDDPTDPFAWAGLRRALDDGTIIDKPAMLAFKAAIKRIMRHR